MHVVIQQATRNIVDHVRACAHSLLRHLSMERVHRQRHMLQVLLFC